MRPFAELLEESVALHGHLCPGQVLGVRMARAGCQRVNVDDPKATRDLIVYVEMDRCAADAIQAVTGCRLGRRTLKHVDYGKMAATFLNTATGQAARVSARDDSRQRAWAAAPPGASKEQAQLRAYQSMSDGELFVITPVRVQPLEEDLPGHPVSRVVCERCGEGVSDRREVRRDGHILCRSCANGAYYAPLEGGAASPGAR